MAISYRQSVQGHYTFGAQTDYTLQVTYPLQQQTSGKMVVVVGLSSSVASITSIVDTAGNTYTQAVRRTSAGGHACELWTSPGGSTDVTGQLTVTVHDGSAPSEADFYVCASEYSGVVAIGSTTASNTAASTNPTVSLTTTSTNGWVVAGFYDFNGGALNDFTAGTGNLRAHDHYAPSSNEQVGGLVDNTSVAPASVTCSVTDATSASWVAVAVELIGVTVDNQTYSANATIQDTVDKTYSANASVQDTVTASYAANAAIRDTVNISYSANASIVAFATKKHLSAHAGFRVMVEVDWPGGHRRYSDSSFAVKDDTTGLDVGFDGRLMSIGAISSGVIGDIASSLDGGGKDSLRVSLLNLAAVATVESLWTDAAPPEGSEIRVYYWFVGDPLSFRIEVFRGIVEAVESVSRKDVTISAFAIEELYDVLLGKEINATDFPNAPPESLGKMQPIVFGTVLQSEGVPTTLAGKSNLASVCLKGDTTATLEDVTYFPDSGTIIIGQAGQGESRTYTTRNTTTNQLGGGTLASTARLQDYPAGTEVRQTGTLDVLLSRAAAASIGSVYGMKGTRFALLAPALYTTTLTAPAKVSFAAGWPTIPVPSGSSKIEEVNTDSLGAANTALNGASATAGDPNWLTNKILVPATVRSGNTTLDAKVAASIAPRGQILRVWAFLEYNPDTLGTAKLHDPAGVDTSLTAIGNLPADIKNRAGLSRARAYDDTHTLSDPTHSHPSADGAKTVSLFFDTYDGQGSTNGFSSPERIIDGQFVNPSLSLSTVGGNTFKVSFQKLLDLGGTPTLVRGLMDANGNGTATAYTVHVPGHTASQNVASGSRTTTQTGTVAVSSWADVQAAYIDTGAFVTGANVWEAWIEVTYTPAGTAAAATGVVQTTDQPLKGTVVMLAEVTSTVAGLWSWFTNKTVQGIWQTGATLEIVRAGFLVEFDAFRDEPCDKILADVGGLVPAGSPPDILASIVTDPTLMNLPASAYSASDFAVAKASYTAASFRLDFRLGEKIQASALIQKIAVQSRALVWWEVGHLSMIYDPDVAAMGPAVETFQDNDVDNRRDVVRNRTALADVVTDYTGVYYMDYRQGRKTKVAKASRVTTVGKVLYVEEDLDLIRDDTSAALIAAYRIDHRGIPRYALDLPLLLMGLDVRRGDVAGVSSQRLSLRLAQIVRITLELEKVTLRCLLFDSL